ncbi:GDSL esterase/lipase APG-like [Zingiber officinale]|uniref:GDSL esterase/lipase APG n=1 Tax=Zingiber officinale TaxID=94328 RepID=A0A8J5KZE3_ZINOF|nr:GDSL esterase/lipase APG-like [Zingiber officinale]KAG6498627.1 hypothetical protein ZIOFF_038348 [Zingiber officinale]
MGSEMRMLAGIGLVALLLLQLTGGGGAQPLVPAIFTFGDSSVDVGNNNYLKTLFRADFPPYGRDFPNHQATGRFCNGKLATDLTADTLGFTSYAPAYLSPQASGSNLLIGANFASAGSGYSDDTSNSAHAIPLSQQLEYFREYQSRLPQVAGGQTSSIITESLYVVSTGSSDFIQNYYVNPLLFKTQSPAQFSAFLVGIYANFIRDLYHLGARRIGVTNLPPLGCVPVSITLYGHGSGGCIGFLNAAAQEFNRQINASTESLTREFPDLRISIFDIYQPFYDLVNRPADFGFFESRRGCCGTGTVETTVFLCNPHSIGTCPNATGYVFWDAVHPSESANQLLSDSLIGQGINLIL